MMQKKVLRSKTPKALKEVGWIEWAALPDLKVKKIKLKLDSGARSSALHAQNIRYRKDKNNKDWVSFVVVLDKKTHMDSNALRVEKRLIEMRKVRSSDGKASIRPVIESELHMAGHKVPIEITLVDRSMMGYRMLLGRQAMEGLFLINPGRRYLLGKEP